ncbi:MAG: ABC transporter ATP-binding protein [Firmicutes bacterium]|nr:ABC transporter ATP-binding protein [Dethiobacter sp.]MBS3888458.1 ABC transporter ATP-binding protein [Bacillota bacterium]MBS4055070.1 ABC transporter ATP-binding protein [Thermaerobacter sp.]
MANALLLERITKSYGTKIKTQVLHGVDLAIESGTINSIIGQSGSGKSTLLNIIGTLDRPTSGSITIDGRATTTMSTNQLAQLRNEILGFVFQFHYLLPEFTALENILMPARIMHKVVTPAMVARASELADLVGLEKVKNNLSTNMSGGQQQRTAIARALMNNPKILLADEPTGNLDSDSAEKTYQLLRSINKQFGTTIVIITHDQNVAQKADRIIEVRDGRIVLDVQK